ncbi:beta carbonic anhydrase clade D [Peziza echinospora]|nr:beta carbonic anhydrase clade D [Peziza echinospora]
MSTPQAESANIDNFTSKNSDYVTKTFTKDIDGRLALPPAKNYAIVTCMDARIIPSQAFGINLGDAHVIRNAGASAKDALRSLVISQQLLGTREVFVIKHTDCGMLTFTNPDIHAVIEKNLGVNPEQTQRRIPDFLPFSELEQAVKEDVEFIKADELILKETKVSGWIYDVTRGTVSRVV